MAFVPYLSRVAIILSHAVARSADIVALPEPGRGRLCRVVTTQSLQALFPGDSVAA